MGGRSIPTAPSAPTGGSGTTPGGSTGSGGSSSATGSGGSSGSGGGGGGGYGSDAWWHKQQAKTRRKYIDQANTIELQAKALRLALDKTFKHALDVKLANVLRGVFQQDQLLMRGYRGRLGDLEKAKEDNDKAASDTTYSAVTEASRQRANALSEAMNNGAGESDVLAAQGMALRAWDANKAEIDRSRADTLRSINSGVTDLVADTRTGRANIALQGNADREQLWTNYWNQRVETWTNLGNTLGQEAEYLGAAKEAGGGKKVGGRQKRASKASGDAFMHAAREAGRAWKNPGVPDNIQDWSGASPFDESQPSAPIESALTTSGPMDKPEGATLRKWTT